MERQNMLLRERTLTVQEFLDIVNAPEYADKRVELIDGEIVEMPPSRRINTVIATILIQYLAAFVYPRKLGYLSTADGGYVTGERSYRQPDVGYISLERAGGLEGVTFDVAPDLAVEVVSPDEDVYKKALEYLRAGTRIVWAVYPDDRTIHVMTLDADGSLRSHAYGVDATLDGGEVLPEFTLAVRDVFPD
jgi:Uma2 family endonuclease